jgi:hypothetical protein
MPIIIYWVKIFISYRNTEFLLKASKEVSLEVNAEKTKYIFTSHYQYAGYNHNLMTANKLSENMVKFKYLGTTVTYQNCIHKEIRSRLNTVNVCYHFVQNLFVFLSPP